MGFPSTLFVTSAGLCDDSTAIASSRFGTLSLICFDACSAMRWATYTVGTSSPGAHMRSPGFASCLFVLLFFGLSLAIPAQDLAETAFDESETLPFESADLTSVDLVQTGCSAAEATPDRSSPSCATISIAGSRPCGREVHRMIEVRLSLALHCILLC